MTADEKYIRIDIPGNSVKPEGFPEMPVCFGNGRSFLPQTRPEGVIKNERAFDTAIFFYSIQDLGEEGYPHFSHILFFRIAEPVRNMKQLSRLSCGIFRCLVNLIERLAAELLGYKVYPAGTCNHNKVSPEFFPQLFRDGAVVLYEVVDTNDINHNLLLRLFSEDAFPDGEQE